MRESTSLIQRHLLIVCRAAGAGGDLVRTSRADIVVLWNAVLSEKMSFLQTLNRVTSACCLKDVVLILTDGRKVLSGLSEVLS